ncbi:MAG: CoA-binding protein [Bacteroidales bacterium]
MQHKHTLVIGVSRNPYRYANMAVNALRSHGHPVYAIGREAFIIDNVQVMTEWKDISGLHTITLYIRPELQKAYYDKILNSGARRIIFNPGTWNDELASLATEAGMEVEDACTLVMLSSGQF